MPSSWSALRTCTRRTANKTPLSPLVRKTLSPLQCLTATCFKPTFCIRDSENSSLTKCRPPVNQKRKLEAQRSEIGNPPAQSCRLLSRVASAERGFFRIRFSPQHFAAICTSISLFSPLFVQILQNFLYCLHKIHLISTTISGILYKEPGNPNSPIRKFTAKEVCVLCSQPRFAPSIRTRLILTT